MKKITTFLLVMLLVLATLLTGCKQSNKPTAKKDTLIVGNSAEPTSLDPPNQNATTAAIVCVQIYDGLVRQNNQTGKIEPSLAKSWERVDDYTIRFHLRDDVYFHDGGKLTAEDVKFTFDRGEKSLKSSFIFAPFDTSRTKIIDEYTIELGTKEVFAPMLTYLTNNGALIVSKHAVESMGDEKFARNPVGTGAFKFVDWVAGDRVILERNEKYWGEKPEFKNLIIRTVSDETARAMALEAGEIDIILQVAPSQVSRLKNNTDVDILSCPSYVVQFCGFNSRYAPLSDVRVRKALRYAVDLNIAGKIAFEVGSPADGPVTTIHSFYKKASPELLYDQNIEKAKALLKEAGYENGFDLEIACNEGQSRITMAEALASAWKAIGVRAKVRVMEFSAQQALINAGEAQASIEGFVAGGDDGDFFNYLFYTGNPKAVAMNYSNPRVDELFDLARQEFDQEKRIAYYWEIQDIIRNELPLLYIWFPVQNYGIQKNLTGLDLDPESYIEFRFVKTKP